MPPAKPFKSYNELLDLLQSRGMIIEDRCRALRKLTQVGYYRLSGFWYPCRTICFDEAGQAIKKAGSRWRLERHETFVAGTSFNAVFDLYLFDKRLRLLLLDALERIEIYIRSIIAHELGSISPLAYLDDAFISPSGKTQIAKHGRIPWEEFKAKQKSKIAESREDCILWHKESNREIPFWVAIETWDFGMLNKYYSMLDSKYRNIVCSRIEKQISPVFGSWLHALNILRNKCAHHSRIWNITESNPIKIIDDPFFAALATNRESCRKLFGFITIIWYLVKLIGPNSDWLKHVDEVVGTLPQLPNCTLRTMGFPPSQDTFT